MEGPGTGERRQAASCWLPEEKKTDMADEEGVSCPTFLTDSMSPTAVTAATPDWTFLVSAIMVTRGTEPSCQS